MASAEDNLVTIGKTISSHTGQMNIEHVKYKWVIDDIQGKMETFGRGQFIQTSQFSSGKINWVMKLIPNTRKLGNNVILIVLLCKTDEFIQKKVSWKVGRGVTGEFHLQTEDPHFVDVDRNIGYKLLHSYVQSNPEAFPDGKLEVMLDIQARHSEVTTVTKTEISSESIEDAGSGPAIEESEMTGELSNHLKTVFENKLLTDFKIICEGEVIECHKAILAGRSIVFRAMIESSMTEAVKNQVEINDFGANTIKVVVKFMYSGTVDDIKSDVEDLLKASDKYNIEGLKRMCVASLAADVKLENAIDMFVLGDMYHAKSLKDVAKMVIIENPSKIVDQEGWKEKIGRFKDLIFEVFESLAKAR